MVRHYQERAATVAKGKNRSKEEQEWLDGYCANHMNLIVEEEMSERNIYGRSVSQVNLFENTGFT